MRNVLLLVLLLSGSRVFAQDTVVRADTAVVDTGDAPIVIDASVYKSHGKRPLRAAAWTIIVDGSGHGDYRTIQEAINSLPDESAGTVRHIFIRKGVYTEKIYLDKSNVSLEGEDRDSTILTMAEARDIWRCSHPDDWGTATLNLRGSDITLQNLTIQNTYGFDNKGGPVAVDCPLDTASHHASGSGSPEGALHPGLDTTSHQKEVKREGHQMALRSFQTTRLRVINCHLRAYGGDTVSPWNVSEGMFYFKDCTMEGGVDFYCPRGWAFAEHCSFVADNGPACIWHDGSSNADAKTVLKDCSFSGYDGFKLGRFHRDAQFYLIHCSFAANMANQDIYQVPVKDSPIQWGRRVYYFNCHKKGKSFSWYANNLDRAPGAPKAESITPDWVFKGKWDPLQK